MASERCGHEVIHPNDGAHEPCDRPATGWRWYDEYSGHEPCGGNPDA